MEFPETESRRVVLSIILLDNPEHSLSSSLKSGLKKLNPSKEARTKNEWAKIIEAESIESEIYPRVSDTTAERVIEDLKQQEMVEIADKRKKKGEMRDLLKFNKRKIRKKLVETTEYQWEHALWRHLINQNADF